MVKRTGWPLAIVFLLGGFLFLAGCIRPIPNTLPIARFSAVSLHGYKYAPLDVQFDGGDSTDTDGYIVSYVWQFGDGTTATGLTHLHTFTEPGSHLVTLRVQDNRGAVHTATDEIVVLEIPAGQLLRRYEWTYQGRSHYLEILFPASLYQRYRDQPRQPFAGNYDYDAFVLDPLDDPTLGELAEALWNEAGGEIEAFLECALAFVQEVIPYTPDPTEMEYPLYPLETLVDDDGGDCEDTTILYVSLVRARGQAVSMAHVDTDDDNSPDHVLALVPVSQSYADGIGCPSGKAKGVWTINGQLYALAETAGFSLPLGCDPWGLEESDFKQVWNF